MFLNYQIYSVASQANSNSSVRHLLLVVCLETNSTTILMRLISLRHFSDTIAEYARPCDYQRTFGIIQCDAIVVQRCQGYADDKDSVDMSSLSSAIFVSVVIAYFLLYALLLESLSSLIRTFALVTRYYAMQIRCRSLTTLANSHRPSDWSQN